MSSVAMRRSIEDLLRTIVPEAYYLAGVVHALATGTTSAARDFLATVLAGPQGWVILLLGLRSRRSSSANLILKPGAALERGAVQRTITKGTELPATAGENPAAQHGRSSSSASSGDSASSHYASAEDHSSYASVASEAMLESLECLENLTALPAGQRKGLARLLDSVLPLQTAKPSRTPVLAGVPCSLGDGSTTQTGGVGQTHLAPDSSGGSSSGSASFPPAASQSVPEHSPASFVDAAPLSPSHSEAGSSTGVKVTTAAELAVTAAVGGAGQKQPAVVAPDVLEELWWGGGSGPSAAGQDQETRNQQAAGKKGRAGGTRRSFWGLATRTRVAPSASTNCVAAAASAVRPSV